MDELFFFNPDVIFRRHDGKWLASNPRLRCHIEVDGAMMNVLASCASGRTAEQWTSVLDDCRGGDRTLRLMGGSGLHRDHSGLASDAACRCVQGEALFSLFRSRRVLISRNEEADDLLRPLKHPLDMESLGTFHQRVGQQLVLSRQREPWRTWHDQKFEPDGLSLRDNAYSAIQVPFFESFFSASRLKGRRVLDFGCGNGYFSAKMAHAGARVTGVDSSTQLLEIARTNYREMPNIEFVHTATFDALLAYLSTLGAGEFDYVYFQDTLLLLLLPEIGEPAPELTDIFVDLRKLLTKDGLLCAMEPNSVFWLANRYGAAERPYAVVTEYFNPTFGVAPTLDRVINFMGRAGFGLVGFEHPRPQAADGTSAAYQAEFPIWDFYQFAPCPTTVPCP